MQIPGKELKARHNVCPLPSDSGRAKSVLCRPLTFLSLSLSLTLTLPLFPLAILVLLPYYCLEANGTLLQIQYHVELAWPTVYN